MNKKRLLSVMAENGDNQTTLAEAMGIGQPSLSARINGKIDFRQNEIQFIKNRYHLSGEKTDLIFFDNEVSKQDTTLGA